MVSSEEILRKYSAKIEAEMNSASSPSFSKEYVKFKEEMTPEMTRYTRLVKALGSIVSIKPSPKEGAKIQTQLNIAHLDVTASQALSLAIVSMLATLFATCLLVAMIYLFSGTIQLLLFFLGFLASMFIFYYAYTMPKRLASIWRLEASSQMVPAILYVVIYMKHTSNLERAIDFAAQHLEGPLALDFKKIFYDVEIGKFSTVKQSLDNYLEVWRDYAPEFIESMHLVESSLFEPSETRRVQILEKSLQVILDGVYEKMLRYSRAIRSPLTNVYMLGIILPTLGLALLPLASTLLGGVIKWIHVFVIFNILIPFAVFYMTSQVLLKRPGGYGDSNVLEKNPDYPKFISKKPWLIAGLIALPLLIIGFIPFIFQLPFITQHDFTFSQLGLPFLQEVKIFDFITTSSGRVGPFSPFSVMLSLFIPLSVAVFFSTAYKRKTRDLIKARRATQELEAEFTNSLFQLGNRIGDGVPAEIAFARVAESSRGMKTQQFFSQVNSNIQQLGMSLEQALFNKQRGAIIYYPSALISTSMRILVESVKKGLQAAARSLMSISDYVKNIHKIDERLRDLLAEIVSDMKSNMVFLAPLLAGIVVGLSTMITFILSRLQNLTELAGGSTSGFGFASIINIFDISNMVPPYFTQISIGIYLVEISFILTAALVTVDSGKDTLTEKYELSRNLRKGITLYILTALLSVVALSLLASIAIGGLG